MSLPLKRKGQKMASTVSMPRKKEDSKKFAQDLSAEIGRRVEKLSSAERKRRHERLLAIVNRNQK